MSRTLRPSEVELVVVLLCAPILLFPLNTPVMGSGEWPDNPPALESGDINGDWTIDLSDALSLFGYLFLGTAAPAPIFCDTATSSGDSNGDERVDLADGVYLIEHLFGGGPPPVTLCENAPSEISDIVLQILQEPKEVRQEIRRALAATVRFRTPAEALAGGLVPHFSASCAEGLGIPIIDEAYGLSAEPSRPAIYYYAADEKGEMRIVALEWTVFEAQVPEPPALFGEPMAGPTGDFFAQFDVEIPSVYYRQMHLYKHNPDGLFAVFNPRTNGICDCGATFCPN